MSDVSRRASLPQRRARRLPAPLGPAMPPEASLPVGQRVARGRLLGERRGVRPDRGQLRPVVDPDDQHPPPRPRLARRRHPLLSLTTRSQNQKRMTATW